MDSGFLETSDFLGRAKRIYYELIDGPPGRPYLVFLHEGLGCVALWKDFPRALCRATGCPGLVYDRRGYGRSSPLPGPLTQHFMHYAALVELPETVSRLIADHDFFLIGHSDGASISLIFASEKPAGLRGVITEGAHVFVEPQTVGSIRAAVDDFKAGNMRGLFKYHGDKTEGIFKAWSDIWLSTGFTDWNIEYALSSIDRPLLVLQGTHDRYGTPAQADAIVSKAPDAMKMMLERCDHSPHLEMPEPTVRIMKEFVLSRLASSAFPPR